MDSLQIFDYEDDTEIKPCQIMDQYIMKKQATVIIQIYCYQFLLVRNLQLEIDLLIEINVIVKKFIRISSQKVLFHFALSINR
ncbi:hypothetical protein pb186bvf_007253 [Paramecium bursaria]